MRPSCLRVLQAVATHSAIGSSPNHWAKERSILGDLFSLDVPSPRVRHYAATSILKQTGDLELVRQVLRHESLTMALRYAHLTKPDVSAKFRRASPLDNLRAGR